MAHRARYLVTGLAVAVAGCVVAAPTGAGADDKRVSVTGTIEVAHADRFDAGTSDITYELHVPGRAPLEVEPAGGTDLVTGQRVRVSGELEGATVTEATVTPLTAAATATTASVKTVAVILAYGEKNGPRFAPGYKNGIEQELSADNGVDHYYRVSSDGHLDFDFKVFDPIAIKGTDKGCGGSWNGWWKAATTAAKAQSIAVDAYDLVLVAIPPRNCSDGWAGTASIGGRKSVVNASVPNFGYVAAHELGHNLTFQHASTLRCWQGICWFNEYGDPFTVMGAGARTIHAQHTANVGWINEQIVTTSGEYRLARMHSGREPQSIVVRIGEDSYNLEFRSTLDDFDDFTILDPAVNGVMIRWLTEKDDGQPKTYTKLIDMQPSTTSLLDAPLTMNQTWSSPWHQFQITVKRIDTKGNSNPTDDEAVLDIKVTGGGTTPPPPGGAPTIPTGLQANVNSKGRVSLSWTKSTDDKKVEKYAISRNGAVVQSNRRAQVADNPGPGTHTYMVVAVDNDGNRSAPSAPLQVVVAT